MTDLLQMIIGAFAGAAGAFGSVFILARYVLKKAIDRRFAELEALVNKQLELQADAARGYVEEQLVVYPQICEIVYRAKNASDEIRQGNTNGDLWSRDLTMSCRELTEQLQIFRIYLPEDTFRDLHRYKHLLRKLLLIGDMFTLNSSEELSLGTKQEVILLCDEVTNLCNNTIIPNLRGRIQSLQGPLAPDE